MKQLILTVIADDDEKNIKITTRNEGFNYFEVLGIHFNEALHIIKILDKNSKKKGKK